MSEIPDDIRAKAKELGEHLFFSAFDWTVACEDVADLIARALMEERERCAKIADAEASRFNPAYSDYATAYSESAEEIAAAIRSPIQNEDKT